MVIITAVPAAACFAPSGPTGAVARTTFEVQCTSPTGSIESADLAFTVRGERRPLPLAVERRRRCGSAGRLCSTP
jgi:hypothetical protein